MADVRLEKGVPICIGINAPNCMHKILLYKTFIKFVFPQLAIQIISREYLKKNGKLVVLVII